MRVSAKAVFFMAFVVAMLSAEGQRCQINTQGKEFWLTFLKNPTSQSSLTADSLRLSVIISAKNSCSVTVANPITGWTVTESVFGGTYKQIPIPQSEAYNTVTNERHPARTGLIVTATDTISLYSANFRANTYDASNILPIRVIGANYIIQSYPPMVDIFSFEPYYSNLAIVATENGTKVEIIPSVDLRTDTLRPAGVPFTVKMARGQVVYVRSENEDTLGDISGTLIKSLGCKKIAVFAGVELTNLPSSDTGAADHIYEQQFPIETFGTQFVVTNSLYDSVTSMVYDVVRITAVEDTTVVFKNGVVIDTVHSAETHEYRLMGSNNSAFFETSKPTALYMYMVSNQIQGRGLGDPSMVWIAPLEQVTNDVAFATFSPERYNYFDEIEGVPQVHFVNIVAKTSERSNIMLDSSYISGWQTVAGNPAYSYVRKKISHNVHRLNGADFIAYVYGLGSAVSYAYSIGSAVNRYYDMYVDGVSVKDSTVQTDFSTGCNIEFSSLATYNYDTVLWDFGDSHRGGGDTVYHSYDSPGYYTVTMFVYSSILCNMDTDTLQFVLYIDTLRDTVHPIICAGASFDTLGRSYSRTGVYDLIERDSLSGCITKVVIDLTVNDTLRDTIYPLICAGARFDTNGHMGCVPVSGRDYGPYRRQGVYTQYLRDTTTLCFRNLVIDLTVNDTLRDTVRRTICAGATFDTLNESYNRTGIYTIRQRHRDSCFHNLVIDLTVNDTLRDTVRRVICAGTTFDTLRHSFSTAGVYTIRDTLGRCHHNLVVDLFVNDTFRDTIYPEICLGSSFEIGGVRHNTSGVYTHRLHTVYGCDSVVVVNLTVGDTIRDTVNRKICKGFSFDTNNYSYNRTGQYVQRYREPQTGCWKSLVLNLEVMDTNLITIDTTICAGAAFQYHDSTYYLQGTYNRIILYENYCELATLNVVVEDTLRDTVYRTVCAGAPFDTNGRRYFLPGWYTQHLQYSGTHCYHNLVIHLSANDTLRDTIHRTVCAGASFDTNGRRYFLPGWYTQHLRQPDSCYNNLVIHLTVNDTLRDTIHRTVCAGAPFDTNGRRYFLPGWYTQHLRQPDSCYNNLVIHLSVNDTLRDTVYRTVCAGAPFDTNGRRYFLPGWYTQRLRNADLCYHNLVIRLSVNDTLRDTVYRTVCAGAPFDTNGRRYFLPGWYTQRLRNADLCYHNLVIRLSVNDTLRDTVYRTVCAGAPFDTNGRRYFLPGWYTQRLRNADLCYHNLVIRLSVNDTLRDTVYRTVCAGAPFDTNGSRYFLPGWYTQHLRQPDLCYNNLVIRLSVNDTLRDTVYRTVCAGAPFDTNGRRYFLPGWYTQHLRQPDSCYNNLVIHLSVNDTLRDTIHRIVCAGTPFDTNGHWGYPPYYHAGWYTQHLRQPDLCYNNLVIHLTVNDTFRDTLYPEICKGMTYVNGPHIFDNTGVYTVLYHSILGCDSTMVIDLTVRDTVRDTVYRTICAGATFDTLGNSYHLPDVYTITVPDTSVCGQHKLTVFLTVNDTLRDTVYRTVCAGASYDTNGGSYHLPGVYRQYLRDSVSKCFQNLVIYLSVNDTLRDTVYRTICAGASYDTNDGSYHLPGVYRQYLRDSVTKCFQNLVIYLSVNDTLRDTVYRAICAGGHFDTNGASYNSSGVFRQYLRDSVTKCFQNLVIYISVNDTLRDTVYRTICAGASFDTNGRSYCYAGSYMQYLRDTVNGCYENLVINLTVADTIRDTVNPVICAGASYDTNGRSYFFSGSYIQRMRDRVTGCFYNLVINLTVNDTLRDTVNPVICAGATFDTNGRAYSQTGFYMQYLRDRTSGCFHDLAISLTVNDTFRDRIYDTICAGATFVHNGVPYTLSGTYLQNYQTVEGCDSIVEINLLVNDTIRDTVRPVLCAGATFDTNGQSYYLQGVYTQRYRDSVSDCFRNLVIDLAVNDTIRTHIYDTICEGNVIRFAGELLNTTGVYRQKVRTAESCDSITYLHLYVVPTAITRIYDTSYTGTYRYLDTTYTRTGVYYHLFPRAQAYCDSLVILDLWFCDSIVTRLYDTLCNDSTYMFGNQLLTESGVYRRRLSSQHGCDSIVELHLRLVNYPQLQILDSIGLCVESSATIRLATDGNQITWTSSPFDSSLVGQEHNATITVMPQRHTEYRVVVDSVPRVRTCVSTASLVINKKTNLKAIMTKDPPENGGSTLRAMFADVSIGDVVYREWLFHESSPMALDKRYEYDSIVWFEPLPESENYKVRLVVQNDEGCTDTATNTYPVIMSELWVPNAFTPDEDMGENYLFRVGAVNILEYEIRIYNRAGLLVFSSTSPYDSWDGTHNGQPCPPASYVYIINYKTKSYPTIPQKKVGSVLLIR